MVVDILANPENYDKKKIDEHEDWMPEKMETNRSCDLCGDYPCVWIIQRAAVVARTRASTATHLQYREQD
jgi:hypothetical protein